MTVDTLLLILIVFFFVFGLPMIFVIFFFGRVYKPLEQAKITTPRQVIVKEIVMVPCIYCGGLMPCTASFCPCCGAPRKK